MITELCYTTENAQGYNRAHNNMDASAIE